MYEGSDVKTVVLVTVGVLGLLGMTIQSLAGYPVNF